MLVLTRKRDEEIRIGNDIVIRVIKTGSGKVRLGIEAPASVRVARGETVLPEVLSEVLETVVGGFDFPEQTEFYVDSEFEECSLDALLVQN